ncbi:50S ribosomal protein L4 [Candidatus Woesearchaeota archaeon CG10_big_fil_rev_8_21_14_0_10_37_12]|nr:MAG: 50S ribosomal protein L4 [Candidatus Woesearchaeota archaeon CG10_big_fil_rev_8_21_14_0_10_37_12]
MEVKILDAENKETGKQKLPAQFNTQIRPDMIKQAVETIQANNRQQYGADPRAGQRASANLSRRRRDYKGSYGKGISRVPRKTMVRRGMQMIWVGAFAPGTVGGRKAHPPRAEKIFAKRINDKERKLAIRSALAATMNKEIVAQRGHKIPTQYPFILDNTFEELAKTKDLQTAFEKLGLQAELTRGSKQKVRAGKGKTRGRKYKKATGPLLVVSKNCKTIKAAENIPGVNIVQINNINAEDLAPGTHCGRLTLFTHAAIQKLEKEKLFM